METPIEQQAAAQTEVAEAAQDKTPIADLTSGREEVPSSTQIMETSQTVNPAESQNPSEPAKSETQATRAPESPLNPNAPTLQPGVPAMDMMEFLRQQALQSQIKLQESSPAQRPPIGQQVGLSAKSLITTRQSYRISKCQATD